MPAKIVVPELGESVIEATVARWLKREGDYIAVGEPVVELETEKVNLEVGADRAGILARIERHEGEDVQVGEVLGEIEETETPPAVAEKTRAPEATAEEATQAQEETPSPQEKRPEAAEPASKEAQKRATPVARGPSDALSRV